MRPRKLDEISPAQKERIFHIDFRLYFLGTITRNDLVTRFGIKEAAATRDLGLYRQFAPDNLQYDAAAKRYIKGDHFQVLFAHTSQQALLALTTGVGDDAVASYQPLLASNIPPLLSVPDVDILAEVTSAIHQKRPVEITYYSTTSGRTTRTIVPSCLVNNGLRWHVRAYDRRRGEFRDFVLTRMESAKPCRDEVLPEERSEFDNQWNRIVDLELVPHPNPQNLAHPETIARDFHMEDGVLRLQVRAAVAGYLLRLWNVDCSEDHRLQGHAYQLWLSNHLTLYGVNSAALAPGYSMAGEPEAPDGG